MRGGTSKGLIFHAKDLPLEREARDAIFLAAMGSSDPNGRQLDGMGGGTSSTSKVCIVGPSSVVGADVDYTFAQIGIATATVDYAGNCGNMSAAIGPFAVEEGLVPRPADGEAVVYIHNTNTGKVIAARFWVQDGLPVTEGDFALDGVAGTSRPIRLEFLDPGGAKTGKLLPTGNPIDQIEVPGLGAIEASLIDAGNPFVFIDAAGIGATGTEMPEEISANATLMAHLEGIRVRASVLMGLTADLEAAAAMISIPKVALLARSVQAATLSGRQMQPEDYDILARAISVGQPHNAIPLTGALCLAAAVRVPGTIANQLARGGEDVIRIGHPSGTISVDAETNIVEGKLVVQQATVLRTARRIFEGYIWCPAVGATPNGGDRVYDAMRVAHIERFTS